MGIMPPDVDEPEEAVQTGDHHMLWLCIVLLFTSGLTVATMTMRGKKKTFAK